VRVLAYLAVVSCRIQVIVNLTFYVFVLTFNDVSDQIIKMWKFNAVCRWYLYIPIIDRTRVVGLSLVCQFVSIVVTRGCFMLSPSIDVIIIILPVSTCVRQILVEWIVELCCRCLMLLIKGSSRFTDCEYLPLLDDCARMATSLHRSHQRISRHLLSFFRVHHEQHEIRAPAVVSSTHRAMLFTIIFSASWLWLCYVFVWHIFESLLMFALLCFFHFVTNNVIV